ncbi:MAG: hypothetical protein IJ428_01790 [Clostridia bacterium]|nr:hypothetical protein [Clostridia bacterium]
MTKNTHEYEYENLKNTAPLLGFDGNIPLDKWRITAKEKLIELLGLPYNECEPRLLVVAAGAKDTIFPIEGVKKAYEQIERIYTAAGCRESCVMVVGDGGHYNYTDLIWQTLSEMSPFCK